MMPFFDFEGFLLKGDGALIDLGSSTDNGTDQPAPDFKLRTDLKLGQVVLDHERLPMADGDVQINPFRNREWKRVRLPERRPAGGWSPTAAG
jgi:hypothetical protein